ncbi:2114_t:CDS:2 [Entrophospora sp. SA101]|nr:2114_t:CDS:2 [Entrophospora sp. SA101]
MRAFVQPALQSNTFIKSPEPLQITVWIISEGIYTSPNPLKVRLWTNIKNSFESIGWLELEFKEILTISDNEEDFMPIIGCHQDEGYRIFQCTIDTKNVQEGWYEFTVKVQALVDYHDHYWEKSQGNDDSGIKNIFIKDFDKDKDQDIRYFNRYNKRNIECWIIKKLVKFNNENGGNEKLINLGKINNFLRYFGLERLGVHWLVPTIGLKKLDKIKSSNNLLYLIVQQSTGNYLVFIPITTDDYTTSFTSDDQGNLTLRVLSTTTTSDQQDSLDVSFAIGLGPDNPYDISQICMNIIKEEFYERVSHQDVLRVLESLNSNGIKIGYLLLDDGWQQTNNEKQLKDIEADQYKFPQGLKGFIDEAKRKNSERVASICRERCGGQGFMGINRFGNYIGFSHAGMTAEGDNSVLMQKELLADVNSGKYKLPVVSDFKNSKSWDLNNLENQLKLLRLREQILVKQLDDNMAKGLSTGSSIFEVWMLNQSDLVQSVAKAHGHRIAMEQALLAIDDKRLHQTNGTKILLKNITTLFGLNLLAANMSWYLTSELISIEKAKLLDELITASIKVLSPYSLDIVNSLGADERILFAPIANNWESYNITDNKGELVSDIHVGLKSRL